MMMRTLSTSTPALLDARASSFGTPEKKKNVANDTDSLLAHHMTLGRGGEGRVLPSDDADANNETPTTTTTKKEEVTNGRVIIVDAHARLRRARTRRALAALSDEADGLERTLHELERRVGAGFFELADVLHAKKQHDALRLRLRREALRALVVTHAFKHAVRAPRPEPERDSDDDAVAAARTDARQAYVQARKAAASRQLRVLRRLRAEAAAEALPHWDAVLAGLTAIEALNARTCDHAEAVVGSEARLLRRGYALTLFEEEQDDEGNELPGINELLRIANAHRADAARIEFRTTSTHEAEARQPRYGYPWPTKKPAAAPHYDPFANDQATDEDDAGVPPLPFEEDLDLSDMSASSSEEDGEDGEETDDE
jgi:hypothetical protein